MEAIDPAQKDRFHVCVEVPYKPDVVYFKTNMEKSCLEVPLRGGKNCHKKLRIKSVHDDLIML